MVLIPLYYMYVHKGTRTFCNRTLMREGSDEWVFTWEDVRDWGVDACERDRDRDRESYSEDLG